MSFFSKKFGSLISILTQLPIGGARRRVGCQTFACRLVVRLVRLVRLVVEVGTVGTFIIVIIMQQTTNKYASAKVQKLQQLHVRLKALPTRKEGRTRKQSQSLNIQLQLQHQRYLCHHDAQILYPNLFLYQVSHHHYTLSSQSTMYKPPTDIIQLLLSYVMYTPGEDFTPPLRLRTRRPSNSW